ncbi:MFS transporter [Candidatus Woesebacteria bacterium]|nr:MFS transporter [Candidatus Woesebacteria bacterium]
MKNKTLIFLSILMLVNALAYGVIIPLLYPYAKTFGMTPLGLSLLFASFSLFQFLFTPIIGRLSDVYGRRPLLLFSILGTGLSLVMFGMAQTIWQLFVARIIDGITGGNMSVAQAVIADSIKGPERAKAFGMLGASFGFGFLVGPAIGGFLSQYSLSAPFFFSAGLAVIATIFGYFFLEESLPLSERKVHSRESLLNFKDMFHALSLPVIGALFILNFITSTAGNAFIIGAQSITNDFFRLSSRDLGIYFTAIGVVSIVMQGFGVTKLLKRFTDKPTVVFYSLALSAFIMAGLFFARTMTTHFVTVILYLIAVAPLMPLLSGLLSEKAPQADQGEILGINQSYMSLGQIVGPLLAGVVASVSVPSVFLLSSSLFVVGLIVTGVAFNWQFAGIKKRQ